MAAIVTLPLLKSSVNGQQVLGPTVVVTASETDLSTPDTSVVFDTQGVRALLIYLKFANYTGVTAKLQESIDGTNYVDIASATTSTSNTFVAVTPRTPFIRLSVAATLSASADTLTVTAYGELYAVR